MPSKDSKREKAREVVDILEEISELLVGGDESSDRERDIDVFCSQNTQLDRAQLSLCISLIENGVNPEALAVSPKPHH
jgi:mitotic-spindle organizing protein 1